jgi:hypothetical protein
MIFVIFFCLNVVFDVENLKLIVVLGYVVRSDGVLFWFNFVAFWGFCWGLLGIWFFSRSEVV